ncbi:MAG: hypothetical protein J0G32_04520 [Alphaproteobacteria bacterium]|nr:hypothetical protein [Alphaproteobacteria bacterium]OJV17137.1 MAG: hypothetical protein BGO27_06120 [Alphaproteobacteria bacterium 33-17]
MFNTKYRAFLISNPRIIGIFYVNNDFQFLVLNKLPCLIKFQKIFNISNSDLIKLYKQNPSKIMDLVPRIALIELFILETGLPISDWEFVIKNPRFKDTTNLSSFMKTCKSLIDNGITIKSMFKQLNDQEINDIYIYGVKAWKAHILDKLLTNAGTPELPIETLQHISSFIELKTIIDRSPLICKKGLNAIKSFRNEEDKQETIIYFGSQGHQ